MDFVNSPLAASLSLKNSLEITTTLGCPVRCSYCPQDHLLASRGNLKRSMTLDNFKLYLSHITTSTVLHWTGYSEPALSPCLGDMVAYAGQSGFHQNISTTLFGNPASLESIINSPYFSLFTFHLPDIDGLMTGLKVDNSYVELLDYALSTRLAMNTAAGVRIWSYGSRLHPLIRPVIKKYVTNGLLPRKHMKNPTSLHSRAGRIPVDSPAVHQPSSSRSSVYWCTQKRLNKPVLLPDGSLNICCMDYGFNSVYGNLADSDFEKVKSDWIDEVKDSFLEGRHSPCTSCEYYQPYPGTSAS